MHIYDVFSIQGSCLITKIPRNGWIVYTSTPNESLSVGDFVSNQALISFMCLPNHRLDRAIEGWCLNGNWSHPTPDCEPFCDQGVINTYTLTGKNCDWNGVAVSCTDPARPNTRATVACQNGYEKFGSSVQVLNCNSHGQWEPLPQPCTPICGQEAPEGVPLIVGGHEVNIVKAPWHAIIYEEQNLICGGTILNARVILSAMHCFWNRTGNQPRDKSIFRVAVGKSLSHYTAIENRTTQFLAISDIYYPMEYKDENNKYEGDLAVVILTEHIIFHAHIAPICIPYGLRYNELIVPDGWKGWVAGFGLTSSRGSVSQVIKMVELPVVSHERCINQTNANSLLTRDKFCAGFVDTNVSVCSGDSGGGLVFPQNEYGKMKHYIRGIVSTGLSKDGNCDSNKYAAFTNVLFYERLIQDHEVDNRAQ